MSIRLLFSEKWFAEDKFHKRLYSNALFPDVANSEYRYGAFGTQSLFTPSVLVSFL